MLVLINKRRYTNHDLEKLTPMESWNQWKRWRTRVIFIRLYLTSLFLCFFWLL